VPAFAPIALRRDHPGRRSPSRYWLKARTQPHWRADPARSAERHGRAAM